MGYDEEMLWVMVIGAERLWVPVNDKEVLWVMVINDQENCGSWL